MHRGQIRRERRSLLDDYSSVLGGALMRHRVEVAERAKRIEAERANEVIAQFIANMSHELRTPLNAIIGFSNFMQDADKYDLSQDQIKEYSGFIHSGSNNLLEIINDILEFSKLQSGDYTEDIQDISLLELLQSCIKNLKSDKAAPANHICLQIAPDLPVLKADMFRLKQIFSNILQNTLKQLPAGHQITISALAENRNFMVTRITDIDNGRSAIDIWGNMVPFSQAHADFSEDEKGSGLGLSMTNALVDSQGGYMEINYDRNAGFAITVNLPFDRNDVSVTN